MLRTALAEALAGALRSAADQLQQQRSAIPQNTPHLLQQQGMVVDSDVLEHADAGDLVVGAGYLESIAQLDRRPVLQSQSADLFLCVFQLPLRQRQPVRPDAISLGSV